MSMSCMCEPVETAQSLGDDTHAVGTRPKWAREHGLHTSCGPFFVGGLQAWPIDLCSNKDAGKRERETPTLCGKSNRRNPKEQHTSCPLLKHTNLHMSSHFLLTSLFSLSALSSPTFFFSSFVLPSRCIVQISSSFLHCFSNYPSHSLFSLSTRLASSSFAHLRKLSPGIKATHTRPPSPSSLPLFSSHFSLLSLHTVLSSSLLVCSLFSPMPFVPSLAFVLFCLAPFGRLVLFSISPLTWPPSLPFFARASPGIWRQLLGSELRGRRTHHLQRHAFCPQTAKPPNSPTLFSGMAGGECASRAVKNLDVTLVPPAARSQRTVEAACCELPAPSTHRSFVFPCSFPVFCVVSLLFSAHSVWPVVGELGQAVLILRCSQAVCQKTHQ